MKKKKKYKATLYVATRGKISTYSTDTPVQLLLWAKKRYGPKCYLNVYKDGTFFKRYI